MGRIFKSEVVRISPTIMKLIVITCIIVLALTVTAQPPRDQFSIKEFRCIKKSNPFRISARSASDEYQEYNVRVSGGHSLKETENILKKICDNLVPVPQDQVKVHRYAKLF